MRRKLIDFIDWTLSPAVTPLAYLVSFHSLIFGGSFVFFSNTTTVQSTLLWQIGALIGGQFWGLLVLIACILLLYGLIRRHVVLVNAGSFAMFMLWLFALIAYALSGLWLQGILAFVTMNYFGYFNLAAYMNRLWDYTPIRD